MILRLAHISALLVLGIMPFIITVFCDESVEQLQQVLESAAEGEEPLGDDPRAAAYKRLPQRTYDRVIRPGYGQRSSHPCDQSSCYPATGNLLIGREDNLSASSTCGLNGQEKYCIVSHLRERKKCFWCRSTDKFIGNPRYEHRIQNIVYRFDPRTKQRSWFQSENGRQDLSVRINLEAEFHFTHLIMTFRTFRPAAMLIERSFDFGKTWKVYRYFAYDCGANYPGIRPGPPRTIEDVVCESRYSAVEPSTEGEVIFRVLPPNIRIDNPYSEGVQNLLKITNLRVNFTKLHTLGDELLDTREDIKEKYYYAIYDMVVRGSCSCYGHASRCLPLQGITEFPGMVHGRCECTHNTQGFNCDKCQDFYHDLPWRPAVGKESNACKQCNCNSHADTCHFDRKVYEATYNISGGVCDGCIHNTMGRNCETCLPYFYQDPQRDIRDPDVCQSCDCYVPGSINDAICDSYSDALAGLVAGQCHCKANVVGLKCDRCIAGFWNFTEENSEGCQACTCDTFGTINNEGCDVYSGECQCKRNVIGRDCNQCIREHYGLSEHPDGCQPCDCDVGGSLDNSCDVLTGQCKCRPYVNGRRCDRPEEGYYVGSLNYLTYEGEFAKGSENVQVMMRESYGGGTGTSWTGLGFMRIYEDSYLEFDIENIQTSMDYDLLIRYEPNFRGSWNDVKVTIDRLDGPVDPNGACSNSRVIDDQVFITFSEYEQQVKVFPPICLEKNKRYKIRLDFSRSNPDYDSANAYILIDAIALIPKAERLPFYSGSLINDNRREEYERYRCADIYYEKNDLDRIPEICRQDHLDSVGLYVYKQAFACECDGTGSKSSICDGLGGQCDCKPNVVGRRCDRCAPGTYDFGPQGCQPCECSNVGSLDNFCDLTSGQCECRPNTYGRACNECQPGFWNFPNCQRCECNGLADICDSQTGACDTCRDYTMGKQCQFCIEGYYGDPRLEVGIPCRQCPCPGTVDSGHSFAQRCFLDSTTKDVVCECDTGYAGAHCDVCSDNYYGNPETAPGFWGSGGSCEPCDCNKNVDISRPGNCNSRTGECLQCLFYTGGFNCERCKAGFYGVASNQQCRECLCNLLGTNMTAGSCDHETGQCFCLPNVEGLECDRCSAKHWKIASGLGCEQCACDPIGAVTDQCNEYTGLCDCQYGFGGRKCDQCEANYYGNPQVECMPCDCDWQGSETQQCDHETGQCQCLPGIGGYKCNECARGFTGRAPWCEPCGECFDNWDLILSDLMDRTAVLIDVAGQIKQRGASGGYSLEFDKMEDTLVDIREVINSSNMTSQNLDTLELTITNLRYNFTIASAYLMELEDDVDNTTQRIELADNALTALQMNADNLRDQAVELKKKSTEIQERNAEGALVLTYLAEDRSLAAEKRVEETNEVLVSSDRNRRRIDNLLQNTGIKFNITQDENDLEITTLTFKLDDMDLKIPDLNEKVCDHRGDPCDSYCGGAGCSRCGGLSCNNGLVNTAELAMKFSDDAESAIKDKERTADDLLRTISAARRESESGSILAEMAFDDAFKARNITTDHIRNVTQLVFSIGQFFNKSGGHPHEITQLAYEVLDLDISLQPEQITDLAEKIALTIASLSNIDAVLELTRDDLDLAERLKERAERAKTAADAKLEVAQLVVDALTEATKAQEAAQDSIDQATEDIQATQIHLTQIASESHAAKVKVNASLSDVENLVADVEEVKVDYQINQKYLEDSKAAVRDAGNKAEVAGDDAANLENKYDEMVSSLAAAIEEAERMQQRTDRLKTLANNMNYEIPRQLQKLQAVESAFDRNEKILTDFDEELRRLETSMEEYYSYIDKKLVFFARCSG